MDSQSTRLAALSAPERQAPLVAQGREAPAGELARAEVSGQVAPETAGRASALPLLLVLGAMFLSPLICDILFRLLPLLH